MKSRKHRLFLLFLAGVCTMLLLAGCGEDESVHTGAEAQTEENMPEETQDAEETAGTTDTAETAGTAAKE